MSEKSTIEKITAREILDCRGVPTIEASVRLSSGLSGRASVPSGTSTGTHEAFELRDGDLGRFGGLGVRQAGAGIEETLSRGLRGLEITRQLEIDDEMRDLDGTENLRRLGANAVLAVSLACARAAAMSQGWPLFRYLHKYYVSHLNQDLPSLEQVIGKLPVPLFNIFNGGKHADTNLDFQEFIIIPGGVLPSFSDQLRAGAEIFHKLKEVLVASGLDTDTGIEGGYAPNIDNVTQALDMIITAIKQADFEPGTQIQLGVDVGASVIYNHDKQVYHFRILDHDMHASQLISLYHDWVKQYPFIFIEDGLHEEDWQQWRELTKSMQSAMLYKGLKSAKKEMLIAGDDLFATNVSRLQAGIDEAAANAVVVKPNQIGTLTQTLEFIALAQKNNYQVIVSHRSGETNDTFISDLAVGVGADYIKAGSLARGERIAKYNRLLEIELEILNSNF